MFNVLFDSHVNLKCSILMEQLIMPPLGVITIQLRRVYVLTGSLWYILVLDLLVLQQRQTVNIPSASVNICDDSSQLTASQGLVLWKISSCFRVPHYSFKLYINSKYFLQHALLRRKGAFKNQWRRRQLEDHILRLTSPDLTCPVAE